MVYEVQHLWIISSFFIFQDGMLVSGILAGCSYSMYYPNTPENKTIPWCGPALCTGLYSVWTVWTVPAEATKIQPVGLGGCGGTVLPSWPSRLTRHGLSWLQFNQPWGLPSSDSPIINDYTDTWIKYWWKCERSKMDYLKKIKFAQNSNKLDVLMERMATDQFCARKWILW